MSAKNKKSLKLIIAALVVTLSSVFLPTMGAYAEIGGSNTVEKAKNYLYAAAAYNCVRNVDLQNVESTYIANGIMYGDKISSIFDTAINDDQNLGRTYIGRWLGDSEGYISCIDALDKAASIRSDTNNTTITESEIESGLLKGAYAESSEEMYELSCVYQIYNQEGNFINQDSSSLGYTEFRWPQGYYMEDSGTIKNELSASPISILFNDSSYLGIRAQGGSSPQALNPNLRDDLEHAWDSLQLSQSDKTDKDRCHNIIKGNYTTELDTQVDANGEYVDPSVNALLGVYWDGNNRYVPVLNNNYFYNRNISMSVADAQMPYAANTSLHNGGILRGERTQTTSASSSTLQLVSDAKDAVDAIKTNISNEFFQVMSEKAGGQMIGGSPSEYLSEHPEIKYVILGRYLFNGDGGFSGGCGGVSVAEDDPNFESFISNPENVTTWSPDLTFIKQTTAYASTTGTTKANFRTRLGGDAGNGSGEVRNIAPYPRNTPEEDACTAIADEFNSISGGIPTTARTAVYGYINPIAISSSGNAPVPYNPNPTGAPETTDVNCYTHAGALGWILCPIVESGSQFVGDVYDKFIEPQLVLDSALFTTYDQGGTQGGQETYEAWQTFRNLANIAFVAVFLFVIFSQLTGFGIDNYGIKKILPKLIVAAIIINASYFICQIAIDAANIVGYGIKNIMGTVGQVPANSEFAIHDGGHTLASIGSNISIVALITALAAPAVLGQGIGILISVFAALIGIVIAILTLFVVLAARKALSLVLVIISPLAFLCYMLPNTKKLFNKWLDALKGTLLAFPICAAMVFGGQAVSRIVILASSEVEGTPFFMTLIAAATAVAPIFLIPSVLKKSMGAVSAVIDKASHGVNRFAKGRWQGSKTAKNMKESGAQWADRRASGLKFNEEGKFIGFTKRGERQNERFKGREGTLAARQLQAQRLAALQQNNAGLANADKFGSEEYLKNIQSGYLEDEDKKRISNIEAAYRRKEIDGFNVSNINGRKREDGTMDYSGTGLYQAMAAAAKNNDLDGLKALSNIAAQSEDGRNILSEQFGDLDLETQRALATHIMGNNAKTYKDNARSFHDQLARLAGGGKAGERTISSSSLKGSLINTMDDTEFSRIRAKAEELSANGDTGSDDYKNIISALQSAKLDQSYGNAKEGRKTQIDDMLRTLKPTKQQAEDAAAAEAAKAAAEATRQAEAKAQADAFAGAVRDAIEQANRNRYTGHSGWADNPNRNKPSNPNM